MPLKTISTGRALMGGGTYADKVLGLGPIAYWPLWESSGAVARCLVNPAQNGAYTGVTLANIVTPLGTPCPYFDGANDYVNILTATLAATFNGVEGSMGIWWRHDAAAYNDAVGRRLIYTLVDGNNYILISKSGTNANLQSDYRAGGVSEQSFLAIAPNPAYFKHYMVTWSKAADRVRYYNDGINYETDTVLGNYAGALAAAFIGATSAVPVAPYFGWLAHAMIFARELAPGEVMALATA